MWHLTLLLTWRAPHGICLVPTDRPRGQGAADPPEWVTLWSLPSAAPEHVTRRG